MQTLLTEIEQLKQKLEHIEGVKQEREEEIAHYRAYVDNMEAKLNASQHHIQSLNNALEEEMLQIAPLYGGDLEDLSMKELEILKCLPSIHEDGLKEIRHLQNRYRQSWWQPRLIHCSSTLAQQGTYCSTIC